MSYAPPPTSLDRLQATLPQLVRRYPHPSIPGVESFDVRALYLDPGALSEAGHQLAKPFFGRVDAVLATPRAAVLAGSVAAHLFLPLVVAASSPSGLPGPTLHAGAPGQLIRIGEGVEPNRVDLSIPAKRLPEGSRVLLVDEALTDDAVLGVLDMLAYMLGASVEGVAALIESTQSPYRGSVLRRHALVRL